MSARGRIRRTLLKAIPSLAAIALVVAIVALSVEVGVSQLIIRDQREQLEKRGEAIVTLGHAYFREKAAAEQSQAVALLCLGATQSEPSPDWDEHALVPRRLQ